ncbi:MAG: PQQ-binding-like beta-propeller repeat protein [Pyrinomonadaceae bacterium]
MTNINGSQIGRRFLWVVVLSLFGILSPGVNGQAVGESTASTSFSKCWDISASVLSEQGISADDSQSYYVSREGKVVAVELTSGAVAWTAEVGGKLLSELVLASGKIYTIAAPVSESQTEKPILRAFSSKTGISLWNIPLPASGKYFLAGEGQELAVVSLEGALWLMDPESGRIKWSSSAIGPISSPPRIEGRRLLVAVGGTRVEEFSIETGNKVASAEVDGVPAFVGAGKSSAAVYSDDRGNVHSIQMSGGKNWKFRAGGRVVYIRAVSDNVLLGSADNFIYFMSVEYGNLLWKRRLPGRVASGGLIGRDLAVFTVIGDRSAYIVELEKGRLIDRLDLTDEDAFLLTPIRANGKYLVAATGRGVTAFSTDCGKEKSGKQLPLNAL